MSNNKVVKTKMRNWVFIPQAFVYNKGKLSKHWSISKRTGVRNETQKENE